MPQVYVCPACREEITDDQKYVVMARDQYGVEIRIHAECEKRRGGGRPAGGFVRPRGR